MHVCAGIRRCILVSLVLLLSAQKLSGTGIKKSCQKCAPVAPASGVTQEGPQDAAERCAVALEGRSTRARDRAARGGCGTDGAPQANR